MEEEKKEILGPKKNRKVSLFKRRKKPNIRPFVRQKKHYQFKKIIFRISICVIGLFALAGMLFILQKFIIPNFFLKNSQIISPQQSIPLSNPEIEKLIRENSDDATDVHFSTSSAAISYLINGSTVIYLSAEKDIAQQLSLVRSIELQIISDGKQANIIDLRYNKPVVRY